MAHSATHGSKGGGVGRPVAWRGPGHSLATHNFRNRATGPLPSLEAIQSPHPGPSLQLAAVTPPRPCPAEQPGLRRQGGGGGGGKTSPRLESLPECSPVEPGASCLAHHSPQLQPLVGSEPLLITQPLKPLGPAFWAKISQDFSCGWRDLGCGPITARPGLRTDTRGVDPGGGLQGGRVARTQVRCETAPCLSFPICKLEMFTYSTALYQMSL